MQASRLLSGESAARTRVRVGRTATPKGAGRFANRPRLAESTGSASQFALGIFGSGELTILSRAAMLAGRDEQGRWYTIRLALKMT